MVFIGQNVAFFARTSFFQILKKMNPNASVGDESDQKQRTNILVFNKILMKIAVQAMGLSSSQRPMGLYANILFSSKMAQNRGQAHGLICEVIRYNQKVHKYRSKIPLFISSVRHIGGNFDKKSDPPKSLKESTNNLKFPNRRGSK